MTLREFIPIRKKEIEEKILMLELELILVKDCEQYVRHEMSFFEAS